jgi:hypothetical protein
MTMPDDARARLVNSSGFVLQLGVESQLVESRSRHNFEVVSREHPWRDERSDVPGFIDLVLRSSSVVWVMECKRVREAEWCFLCPTEASETKTVRCLWSAGTGTNVRVTASGWDDLPHLPMSLESAFCVVRGTGEQDSPMIERIGGLVCRATDALAAEEYKLIAPRSVDFLRIYMPVIVTTATINVCRVEPKTIALTDGSVKDPSFLVVPMIRFRKAFDVEYPPGATADDLSSAAKARERTILVINAEHFVETLASVKAIPPDRVFGGEWPWEVELRRRASK